MSQKFNFLTPVGRLLQGDPFEKITKDKQGNQLLIKNGSNTGQPTHRWVVVLGFPKVVQGQPNAEFAAFYALLDQAAKAGFPALSILPPWDPACRFAWKVMDGDGIDGDGKPNNVKTGFAGHWIVKFSSSLPNPPKCFYLGRHQPREQIQDPNAIKRGWYVRIGGTLEANGNAQKPGLYVNLGLVELCGGGPDDIIHTGPDAAAIFATAPVLPAGVAALPMNAGALPAPGGLPTPAHAVALPMATGVPVIPGAGVAGLPTPGTLPVAAAPVLVAPNHGILAGPTGLPTPGGLPVAPVVPAAPVYQMTALANGYTRDQLVAQGWTDELLREKGVML